jgi:prepilin-type N-terminal cleavage/methylation domain-containing protein
MKKLINVWSRIKPNLQLPQSAQRGFTLVEFLLVMSIFAVMTGIATVNLFSFQRESQLNATFNTFVADLKNQQMKAMSGDTGGASTLENYGINLDPSNYQYILFSGTYSAANAANFAVSVPNTVQVTTTFPNSQVIFQKGSGDVSGYTSATSTITLRDTATNEQRVIQLNRYGVITGVTN